METVDLDWLRRRDHEYHPNSLCEILEELVRVLF